jgi:hypothetical protein
VTSSTDLRPLSVGETLDRSFGIYRRLLVPLLLIQLICVAPVFPLQLFLVASGRQLSGWYLLFGLIGFLLSCLASAATALLIAERYLGRDLSAGESLQRSLPRVGTVIAVSLLLGLVLMISMLPTMFSWLAGGGLLAVSAQSSGAPDLASSGAALGLMLLGLAFMVLPVIVMSALAVSLPALIVEHVNAGAALSRSWALTKGRRLRVAFTLFVLLVIIMIPYVGLQLLFGISAPGAESGGLVLLFVLQYGISLLLTPLLYCVITLLYFDLRVRREAFDLEILAGQVATA